MKTILSAPQSTVFAAHQDPYHNSVLSLTQLQMSRLSMSFTFRGLVSNDALITHQLCPPARHVALPGLVRGE